MKQQKVFVFIIVCAIAVILLLWTKQFTAQTFTLQNRGKDVIISELTRELKRKLEAVPSNLLLSTNVTETCGVEEIKAGGCGSDSQCKYATTLPESYEDRINQLVLNERLQIQPDHLKTIQLMGDRFKKRPKFLLLTGTSSNHYLEIQAMIRLVHKTIPYDFNYEFIVYDLGLSTEERNMMSKFCNCTVLSFPFSAFPGHVKDLNCYSWKPLIVYAHSRHADVVMWADSSIRLSPVKDLRLAIQLTRERGLYIQIGGGPLAKYTLTQMFHYFGDEPCVYKPYEMWQATGIFFHNETFVRQAILAPWVACALKKDCMCPAPPDTVLQCIGIGQRWKPPYSVCHRFDQSAISIILLKLYQRAFKQFTILDGRFFHIQRDTAFYFNELAKLKH